MAQQSLPLPSPDFETLKQSLKEFLKNQDTLKDYDFDGSTMNVLLDVLAYNSHLNAFWLNMVANEAFLTTAIKRSNVVSAAKNLNYIPKSATSAFTDLYIEYQPTDEFNPQSSITIPAGTIFLSSSENTAYTFNVLEDYVAEYNPETKVYVAPQVRIYEGRLIVHEYSVVSQKILGQSNVTDDPVLKGVSLENVNIDYSSIAVFVKDESISSDYINYKLYDDVLDLNENTKIYFISEDEFGYPKITFGDGKLGYKPKPGSKIKVVYIISSGVGANGIALFNQGTSIPGAKLTLIKPFYPAGGGSLPESINDIKYNTQLGYEAQGRGVIAADYEYLVKQIYPNVKDILVWGGEDNIPPEYGKVFISIQPKDGLIMLTDSEKEKIITYLKSKNTITIQPILTEPDYMFLDLSTHIYYDKLQSNIVGTSLESAVKNSIIKYGKEKLNSFFKNFEFSKLLAAIDNTDPGIISNTTDIKINKRIYVRNTNPSSYLFNYYTGIKKGTIYSTPFSFSTFKNCRFVEYGTNKLAIATRQNNVQKILYTDAGLIDYEKGIITLNAIHFIPDNVFYSTANQSYYIKLYCEPIFNSIKAKANQILMIENIKVKTEEM